MTKRATSRRPKGVQTRTAVTAGSTLLGVLFLVLLFVLNGCDTLWTDLGLDEGGTPGAATAEAVSPTGPASSGSSSKIKIYFTDPIYPDRPENRPAGTMDEKLAAAIDKATTSVEIVSFEFNLQKVADAILRAQKRGVRVRMVIDADYDEEKPLRQLMKANIPVVFDDREAFMHDKFVVIDGRYLWTGSWNLMDNDTFRNNNNIVVIDSKKLAANYQQEFNELFAGEFGPTSPSDTPNVVVTVDGVKIENYFSPEDGVKAHVLEILKGAETSIDFMAFSFTDDDMGKALVQRVKAGVVVRGVMESRNASGTGSEYTRLNRGKVDIWEDGNPYVLHHKVFIVDNEIVITGSYNFTASAEDQNDENIVIIHSREIAAQYLAQFQKIYEQAKEAKHD